MDPPAQSAGTFGSIMSPDFSWYGAAEQSDIIGESGEWRGLFDIADEGKRPSFKGSFENPNDELFSLLALASVAFGVRARSDFVLPAVAHAVWWASGHKGVDAIYSVMAGQQSARGQYRTAALPALKDLYDFFSKDTPFGERWQKTFWYFLGFLVHALKILR